MDNLITRQLNLILSESELDFESMFSLEVNPTFLDEQEKNLLKESYQELDGLGDFPLLKKLKFDFKTKRFLILYDEEYHFNRYRLKTLRSEIYHKFNFQFFETKKRLCRSFEKDCLKVALNERRWYGPPIAKTCFGKGNDPGDFSGEGSPGWKLQAFNDLQIDLQTRLHGYKLIRLSPYETLMIGGSLRRIDQLLMNPSDETRGRILNWLLRKLT